MPPKFELALSDKNSYESIYNHNHLSGRFLELQEQSEVCVIKDPNFGKEFTKFLNKSGEELYIYPSWGRWFFNKEQDLSIEGLNILDSVDIIPFRRDNGDLNILILNKESNRRMTILKTYKSKDSDDYFFGKSEPAMCSMRGEYFNDQDDYDSAKLKLEDMTGLLIKDFFIRILPGEGMEEVISNGTVQIVMELK